MYYLLNNKEGDCLKGRQEGAVISFFLAFFMLMVVLSANVTLAQTPADIIDAQRQTDVIQRQEQERLLRDQEKARRRTERVEGIDTKALHPKIDVPSIGAKCREINDITIKGAPTLSTAVRESIIAKNVGHCLSVNDIEQILSEITKYYIYQGYITIRVYLPPQDLSEGHLEILVVEGLVTKIIIEDGESKSISIGNVFPGIEGNLLNLRDLEQGIDQVNRLRSNNAKLDIRPGEKTGESLVVVHNQPRSPFHFSVSLDNQGLPSTGEMQGGITAGADNLLGFNESMSVTHRESNPNNRGHQYSGSDSINLSIPHGYSTLSYGYSCSQYDSTIALASGLELVASGDYESHSLHLDRVVYRDKTSRFSLAANLTTKESKNYLDDQFLEVSSRKLTILDLESNINMGLAGGVLTFDFSFSRGLDILGALQDPDNLPSWAAKAQFSKFKIGVRYARSFRLLEKNFNFTSQLTAQKAHDTLYGSEQISIGGLYSVRGFVLNTLAGDDGYYWRNEISLHQPLTIGSETIFCRFYSAIDTGKVSSSSANTPEGQLTGMAVGITANWRGLSVDLFNTQPLSLPGSMQKESSQTWFRIFYSI